MVYIETMDSIRVPVTLYSVVQALAFLETLNVKWCDTWLRKRMKDEKLVMYRVGKSDFVTEADLYRLSRLPKPKPGPKRKGQRQG
jgi:hypothetical protein